MDAFMARPDWGSGHTHTRKHLLDPKRVAAAKHSVPRHAGQALKLYEAACSVVMKSFSCSA